MRSAVITKPGAQPQHAAGQERAEHRAGGADQRDVAAAAIPDLVAEPGSERAAQQGGADDPRGKSLPLHAPYLDIPASIGLRRLPTLGT
jgi:hypothetical protein